MKDETIKNIIDFRDDRDWKQYHNGKDLAISISLEANELLENYQWSAGDIDRMNKIENIKEELADVMIYSFMFADYYGLDVDEIINDKLKKNLIKYPNGRKLNLNNK